MKKQLGVISVVTLLVVGLFTLSAFADASINPWFEVASEGVDVGGEIAVPTLDAGLTLEGMISAAWFVDLGFTYIDADLLDASNDYYVVFEANIGFDQQATVNTTGALIYGCSLSLTSETGFSPRNIQNQYPTGLNIVDRVAGFLLEGYVGPLTLWFGLDLPWDNFRIDYIPKFGILVDFEINL